MHEAIDPPGLTLFYSVLRAIVNAVLRRAGFLDICPVFKYLCFEGYLCNILTELGMSTWVGKPTPSLEIKWSSTDLKAYNHFGLSRSWSRLYL